ncbi:PREDICTED: sulfotransferase family cytosolic 1B member 1-like [Branchiostoma belcheri]|uniref:Sulfotransferase n=1 Tax=Branchiostoma belcheri TaxID=7741 RepID=A0A6P4ZP68_BRABE|nr:PREDICTED: sulfotransferase family cytosolic 1B member 1-like [Branchiostoma belcheri]
MSFPDRQPLVHNGVLYPHFVTMENLEAMKTFQTRDDDIVIVSFPKTGTNWTLEIVTQILQAAGRSPAKSDDHIIGKLEFLYPENPLPSYVLLEDAPSPRVILTHLKPGTAPPGIANPRGKEKILVVMRNPKDAAVSFYHFSLKITNLDANQRPWPKFCEDFLSGKEVHGSFFDHVLSWWEKRDDPHFIFLKYEDMKKDIASEVKRIATFLEADLDAATIAGIAEKCTFEGMKATLDNSRYGDRRVMARKGIVGDWKNHFTDEQNQAFDALYEEKLKGTGLDFEFE